MSVKKIVFRVSLLISFLILASCATNKSEQDLIVDHTQYLEIGKTTKKDITKLAGYPLFASTYDKEDAIEKVEELVNVEIDEALLGDNKHTVWLYSTYQNDEETYAGYDTLFLFDDNGILKQTFTHYSLPSVQ